MNNVSILDCTLRDGGRIIDCKFEDSVTKSISKNLSEAGIEIIELGFLRSENLVCYKGNSTFFTAIDQMDAFIDPASKALFTAFIDYEMFDFDSLIPFRGVGVEGIRVGFTKKQYCQDSDGLFSALRSVKEKGYKLFVQSVNTPGYSDKELLELIEKVNEIQPYGLGIVDTYGALYLDDLTHIYDLVEHNLDKSISIDIHSHNNMQSSFAFSQEISRIAPDYRNVILDATLNGMGKCAGNLNTELIVDYLNRKRGGNYNLDKVLDTIDIFLTPLKEKNTWGYSVPAFMAGIYKSHPNNILYLTEKYRLNSKDIKYIISGISEELRQRYDYDNIARVYRDYMSTVYDDSHYLLELKKVFNGKNVVVLAPGKTVIDYADDIKKVITDSEAITISINFAPEFLPFDYVFCTNAIHWARLIKQITHSKVIVTSNVHEGTENICKINYTSLIEEDSIMPDNSTIMLMNLLNKIGATKIFIAGFDGIKENGYNYVNDSFVNSAHGLSVNDSNTIISKLYIRVKERIQKSTTVELITPSLYYREK